MCMLKHNLAKVGIVGSNPIARCRFSIFVRGSYTARNCRIRQLLTERSTKAPAQYGENPGSLFAKRSDPRLPLREGLLLGNMAMLGLLKDLNRNETGKPRWVDPKSGRPITPQGLRATFRTWGEDSGFSRDLLEEALRPPDRHSGRASLRADGQFRAPSNSDASVGGILSG
jgi:hypothetical protein